MKYIEIIGTIIGDITRNNAILITSYAVTATLAIIAMVVIKRRSRNKYMTWKDETISIFGVYSVRYTENKDEVFQQLFEENQRLELENKALRESVSEIPRLQKLTGLLFVLGLFLGIFLSIPKKEKK